MKTVHTKNFRNYSWTSQSQERESVIEFGCGTGAFTKYLADYNLEIIGVDISEECISYAKKNEIKNTKFIVGDIEHLDFEDNSFDIVVASGVLHHFPDFLEVLKEAYRVLKPGGRFFAYEPNRKNPIMWLYRDKHSPFYSDKGVTSQERPLAKQEIENNLNKAGFCYTNVFAISGITHTYVKGKFASKFLEIYNYWEKIFDKIWLSKYFGSFLIVFAKK